MFQDIYRGKRILLTGHTGFKGSWLAFWLEKLGAQVCGVALPMEEELSHFSLLRFSGRSEMVDIRDRNALSRIFQEFQPDAVFHLAAQPLVRKSYREPVDTFETNVMGTVNVLECCRKTASVRAAVIISSDKCYENRERLRGYQEEDPMGGFDPYSASKGCTELAVSSYRRSFFPPSEYGGTHSLLLASGRAGNVIGGGDWAEDRLVPDLMKAAAAGKPAVIRNPAAVRPWQHVLEPLGGYLTLGWKLLRGEAAFADGWNFGPADDAAVTVGRAAEALAAGWPKMKLEIHTPLNAPHEAGLLRLDCSKAREKLRWHGVWTPSEAFQRTAAWYRAFYDEKRILTGEDWEQYIDCARKEDLEWTK